MRERREHRRIRKRIQVTWGEEEFDEKGVITDISLGGAYIECRSPPKIGTRVHLHVLDRQGDYYLEGVVRRLRLVDPKLRRVTSEGMGVRFLTPEELVTGSFPTDERTPEGGELVIATAAAAERLLQEELPGRVLALPAQAETPDPGTIVEYEIRAKFADDALYEGTGRLVQVLADGRLIVEVREADVLRRWFEERLG